MQAHVVNVVIHTCEHVTCIFKGDERRTCACGRLSLPAPALVGEADPLGAALQPVSLDARVRHTGGFGARHETRHGLLGVAARGRIWNKRKKRTWEVK